LVSCGVGWNSGVEGGEKEGERTGESNGDMEGSKSQGRKNIVVAAGEGNVGEERGLSCQVESSGFIN